MVVPMLMITGWVPECQGWLTCGPEKESYDSAAKECWTRRYPDLESGFSGAVNISGPTVRRVLWVAESVPKIYSVSVLLFFHSVRWFISASGSFLEASDDDRERMAP